MGFDTIGPYSLRRRDLIAAALVISFVTGSKATRWKSWVIVAVCVSLILMGISDNDSMNIVYGIGLALLLFVVAPGVRSLKQVNPIYPSCSPEGIVAETPILRTTYKWSTISKVKRVGSRLFIMISPAHALVVSDHITSADNMARLIASLGDRSHDGTTC
ncbi:YcxB family protein [Sphingomonas trueperi]|uniref:YcxB family protein n=1 Tax=Sphingomonas trueperi TaxID=53317 RepID=UPI000EB207A7